MSTLTVDVGMPAGFVTRMRQGDGAHPTNRVFALGLLLICSSTFTLLSLVTAGVMTSEENAARRLAAVQNNARVMRMQARPPKL
jgi:hypothetical protein